MTLQILFNVLLGALQKTLNFIDVPDSLAILDNRKVMMGKSYHEDISILMIV